ncbi:hypothetical protein SAMN04488498_101207 [Mesorhizobium albiziae]|uniref:Uncharacterized protein n=1 Tax=Neomesorhizobium albiziae TaxID=335020 RepID=A0A1I3V5Q2_9HYPH|nr:hypothetical protein SAMN04488498_101207 [Mesorhizobium albiziae]
MFHSAANALNAKTAPQRERGFASIRMAHRRLYKAKVTAPVRET